MAAADPMPGETREQGGDVHRETSPPSSCSKCGAEHRRLNQRYCESCHAAYMREWRKTHPLTGEARRRDLSRHIAGVYHRARGEIGKLPCQACGSSKSQMHHPDHERPRDVTWLCRPCHLEWHGFWRATVLEIFSDWLRLKRH